MLPHNYQQIYSEYDNFGSDLPFTFFILTKLEEIGNLDNAKQSEDNLKVTCLIEKETIKPIG